MWYRKLTVITRSVCPACSFYDARVLPQVFRLRGAVLVALLGPNLLTSTERDTFDNKIPLWSDESLMPTAYFVVPADGFPVREAEGLITK